MDNFSLNGSVPWLKHTESALCFICKDHIENADKFLFDCPRFKENFDSIWRNLYFKIIRLNRMAFIKLTLSRIWIVNIR